MQMESFDVEHWMDLYETKCKYNLAETCVDSISLEQLINLTHPKENIKENLMNMRLSYGEIPGRIEFRRGVASLYREVSVENILTTNGAIGGNFLALYTLVEPGDEVVAIVPTYQQHYSIPKSLGATVKKLTLEKADDYLPNIKVLETLVNDQTKVICINSPNNPTGQVIDEDLMNAIVKIAKTHNAYILCDEVYRHLTQEDIYMPSIVDLYDKGISTGSMSKVFSMAGLRLGWIVAPNDIIEKAYNIRHYNMISCGMIDEYIGSIALKYKDKLLNRNKKIIRENLEILDDFIRNERHLSYIKPVAGTTALINYDMPIQSTELCTDMMETEGLMLVPGDCFQMNDSMRIGYAFNPKDLKEGLDVLKRYLRKYD